MKRRVQGPTLGQGPLAGAPCHSPSRPAPQRARGGIAGHASCDIARQPEARATRAKLREPEFGLARPWLATLALLALGIPAVHGQPAASASAASGASAASRAAEPPPTAPPPASAAGGHGRTMPPPLRGGSQSEAMHACRSLPGERAQHDCMLRHQAMPPYGEGEVPYAPRRP